MKNESFEYDNQKIAASWILRQMHGVYPKGSSERWALEIAIKELESEKEQSK